MAEWDTLRRNTFRAIFDAASRVGAHVIIAGGAAVDFRLASDVDVFVLQQPWYPGALSLAGVCASLLEALGGTALLTDAETYVNPDDCRGQFCRAGVATPDWSPKSIHVIGWRHDDGYAATTPVALLETFDLSIHAWGVDETFQLIACDNSTLLKAPISIVHMTPTTPERLVKLTERYFPPLTEVARG